MTSTSVKKIDDLVWMGLSILVVSLICSNLMVWSKQINDSYNCEGTPILIGILIAMFASPLLLDILASAKTKEDHDTCTAAGFLICPLLGAELFIAMLVIAI